MHAGGRVLRAAGLAGLVALASACTLNPVRTEGEAAQAIADYQACRAQGLEAERAARQSANVAGFGTAARILKRCLDGIAAYPEAVSPEEQMRLWVVRIRSLLVSGDVQAAASALTAFRAAFPDRDLYLADHSSVTDSFEALLSIAQNPDPSLSRANVSPVLRDELRRIRYWSTH